MALTTTLASSRRLWNKTVMADGFKQRILEFCLAALTQSGQPHKFRRICLLLAIRAYSRRKAVIFRFQIAGSRRRLFLRSGCEDDYLAAGELICGQYPAPVDFTPDRIIDAGANIGAFSVVASALYPEATLVCYEPDAENFLLLRKNINCNGIVGDLRNKAAWSEQKTLSFLANSSLTGHVTDSDTGVKIECERPEITEMTWLKLDVEGAEYELLNALLSRNEIPRHLSIEIHYYDTKGPKLVEQLREAGYAVKGNLDSSTSDCIIVDASLSSGLPTANPVQHDFRHG